MDKYEIINELLAKRDCKNWYKADITDENGESRIVLITDVDKTSIRCIDLTNKSNIDYGQKGIEFKIADIQKIYVPYLKLDNEQFKSNEI